MSMYDSLAQSILENLGGASNITRLTHCITRLRVVVKDESKVRVENLNATQGVAGVLKSYGQYMIIIGTNVPYVYDAVCEAAHINAETPAQKESAAAKQKPLHRIVAIMTDVFAPFLGGIAACGVLKGLLSLLATFGVLNAAGDTYNVLYSLADSFFYYMPILLAYTASKRFGLPVPEGLIIAAGLIYPNLLPGSTVAHASLFGIPLMMPPGGSYTSTALPIIAAVAFAAWFERKHEKYVPDAIKPFAVPLITCPVTFALTLWVIGPITVGVTNALAFVLNWLESISHLLFSGLLGAIWQVVLMVGLHWAVLPLVISNLSTIGYDTTLSSTFGCNFAEIGAVLAVALRSKDPDTRKKCLSAALPASVGVIEPALYGVTLKRRKVFIITCIVSCLTGIGMTVTGVRAYRFAGFGIFGYAAYASPQMDDSRGVMLAVLWSIFALVLSFVLVYFLNREDDSSESEPQPTKQPKKDSPVQKTTRRQFLKTTASVGVLGTAAAAGAVPADACIDPPPAAGYPQEITIDAYDWGPCVSSTQFKLRQSVRAESVHASDFQSAHETKDSYDWYQLYAGTATASGLLPVADAYPCDNSGSRADSSRMLRLDFSPVKQDANVVGGVFLFDPAQHTTSWCSDYSLSIGLAKDASISTAFLSLPVTSVEVDPTIDLSQARIPALDPFRLDGTFTGSDGRTLLYASYEPSDAANAPIVVWLHSGEECGSDVRIPLLAEKVSALAGKGFQNALGGSAFVLVPQTREIWSDAQMPVLRELIEHFAAKHPNADTRRIYLGGSGAGGAMTLKMLLQNPGFFAAAFPISETCPDADLSDEQIAALAKTPLWFTCAKDWISSDPSQYTAATVRRLQQIGAPVHLTAWEQAPEQAVNVFYRNRLGTIYSHEGDWSWIYFFNDQCVDDATGESLWQWLGQQASE